MPSYLIVEITGNQTAVVEISPSLDLQTIQTEEGAQSATRVALADDVLRLLSLPLRQDME